MALTTVRPQGMGFVTGRRNLIINGAMRIDQRNAGASISCDANIYGLDRWQHVVSQASKLTVQQNAGSVTPPVGFSNYMGFTSTSAYSVGTTEYFYVQQQVEGYSIANLAWGTASAAAVTLSFRVYSSLTGTFGGSLQNNAKTRSYPFTYTVSSANTWTTISITIAGDTTGTWLTTNSAGITVIFGLGVGLTSLVGTAGAWASADYRSATGATSVVGTSGATLYITGVQLELGENASDFEHPSYGEELALCQRYYQYIGKGESYGHLGLGIAYNTTGIRFPVQMRPVGMRTIPSITSSGAIRTAHQATSPNVTGVSIATSESTDNIVGVNVTVASGLTQGYVYGITNNNDTNAHIAFSAEL